MGKVVLTVTQNLVRLSDAFYDWAEELRVRALKQESKAIHDRSVARHNAALRDHNLALAIREELNIIEGAYHEST